jgi:hypothetical protein
MLLRSAGLLTIVISLLLSFVGPEAEGQRLQRLLWLVSGIVVLWVIANSRLGNRGIDWAVSWALHHWTDLEIRDYSSLLQLSSDYRVMKLQLDEDDWLVDKKLHNCNLRKEGITILGIYRSDGSYVGVPQPDTEFDAGDTLVLYGRADSLQELDKRRTGVEGDTAHQAAVSEEERRKEEQDRQEDAYRRKKRAQEVEEQAEKEQETS